MHFSKITVNLETRGTIILTPKRFYRMSDHQIKYVIIYSLKFINNNPEIAEIESEIPYYISNGETNKLRANMLYPFMCYSSIENAVYCPYDIERSRRRNQSVYRGILLKYNTFENINLEKLEEGLLSTFLGIYPELIEEELYLRRKLARHGGDHGLISILKRITNLVDFIICITSNEIRKFDYKTEQPNIDNGKYRPLSEIQNESVDYIDMSILGKNINADDPTGSFDNHFRLVILTILNRYYKLFVDNHILDIEMVAFEEPEIITVEMFNTMINICNKEASKHNMKKYAIVSNQLSDLIFHKIDIMHSIPEEDKQSLKSIISKTSQIQTDEDVIYNNLLEGWRVGCVNSGTGVNTKNVFTMDVQEICQELSTYPDVLAKMPQSINSQITANCNDETSDKDPEKRLNILRDKLLLIRSFIMLYNYTGVLRIKILGTDRIIKVDVNSSDTIDILKSRISRILSIEPSKLDLSVPHSFSGTTSLDNDRTIGSYKIVNRDLLLLNVV